MFALFLYLAVLLAATGESTKAKTVCSPYPYVTLEHGTIHRVGYQKYSFTCDKGYVLATPSKIRCLKGNWTYEKEPTCFRIRHLCDEPPAVEHAKVIGDERHVGSKVVYICEEGYTLLGHTTLTCARNEHWDKRPPNCMDVNEPLEMVAQRLQSSFVTKLEHHSADTMGKSLDKTSLALGLELFLLIDRSSSVDPVHLEDAKTFVKFLLERFKVRNTEINKNGTRAAVLAFGTEVQTVFDIDNKTISNFQAAANAVNKIEPNGGGTNMEGALTKVMLESVKLRPKAKRALFLMTDGEPNIANPEITPQDIASMLKNNHQFEIFTVGIGKGINTHLLNELASEPPLSHVFVLHDYPDLNEVMRIIEDSKPPPAPVSKDQCGYRATKEDRPWLATLYVAADPFRLCGGVLICSQWVLTTASCLQNAHMKDVFVVLGKRNLTKENRGQTNFYLTDIHTHLHYEPGNFVKNNLALVKMNQPATGYRPACLPPTDRTIPLHLNLMINASIAGFGTTMGSQVTRTRADELRLKMHSTTVSLSAHQECPLQKRDVTVLCAGQGSKTCYGVEGSPLMAEDPSTRYQHVLGLLVYRKHCAEGQSQYVELTRYLGWINHMTSHCQLRHWGLRQ